MSKKVVLIACILAIVFASGVYATGSRQPAASASSSASVGFNATGMPIVSTPVTFSVLTMRWGDMGDSFKQNAWLVDLERRSNVRINWQAVSSNDWGVQKGILLASRSLPDIIFGNQTFNDGDIINNLEFFRPLDDLITQYMPNYSRALQELPALRNVSVFPDGKMYSFAKNLPARPMTRNHLIINKTWLDRLGLAIPTTTAEFTNVLTQFKNRDANGNGNPNDEFPLSFNGGIHVDMLNPFGITDINESMMSIKDGRLFFYPTSEEYRAAYRWLRELWVAGVIDPETFTQNWNMFNGKRLNAAAPLVGVAFEWTPDAGFGQWSDQYVAIPPLAGPDGRRYAGGDANGVFTVQRNEAEITTSNRYPEVAARWIDEFYTNEASIQNFWGAIGTVITRNADGTFSLNNPPAGTSADAWYWDQSLRDFGPKYVQASFNSRIRLDPTAGDGFKLEISKMSDPYVTEPYPDIIFTARETDELSTLGTDIASYVAQMAAKWVTEGGIDTDWDAYVRQLNAMGLQRFVQIKTDAYNRFKSR